METLPERQDPVKFFLSVLMSDEDVARYSDLSYAIETLKRGDLCWHAAASIGVQAGVVGVLGKTDDQKRLVENLVGHALKPMEALHERLAQEAHQQTLTDEQARMVFHLRFGLGFLFLAKGEREAGKALLHDMAATKLSRHGGGQSYRSGDDIVSYTDDMGWGKVLAAIMAWDAYSDAEDYEEALYLMMEAGDTTGHYTVSSAADLLDRWAAKCDRIQQVESWYPQWLEWSPLLLSAMRILEVCSNADTSGGAPAECNKGSAQFLAYKFGQLAARFATKFAADYMAQPLVDEGSQSYDGLLHGLLCEHAMCSDWQKARQAFVWAWELTACYSGIPAEEIGPHTDLYWAMRIGLTDEMLQWTQALVLSAEAAPTNAVVRDPQTIMDTVCSMDRKLDELLTGSGRALRERVVRYLIPVSDLIPSEVLNHLEKAEALYRSKVNDADAKLWFVKAVEAALSHCFVEPLIDFMQQERLRQVDLPFPPPRSREWKTAEGLRKVKLWEWPDVFDTLVGPARKDLSALGAKDLRRFMDQRIGLHWPDFRPLAQSLRRVQELRGGSAHYQQAETRVEKDLWDLEQIRNLVLGLAESPSVIAQIYRLLAPSKQP